MRQLRPYQVADLAFMMATPVWGNFSDPGVGKTAPVCVFLGWLWQENKERSIWAMPKSLLKKNQQELMDWTGLALEDCPIVDGTPGRRSQLMATDGKIFLMGYDCFARNWPELVTYHPDITGVYGDEWHMGFKGPKSKRTQSLYNFMARSESKRMGAMTGTIIDGRLDSAFSLIKVALPHYYDSYEGFLNTHAMLDDFGKIAAWVNLGKVSKAFGQIAVRHTFEEAYGPEAKVITRETAEMTETQRSLYDEFEETALLELEDSWLDGTLPGVNLIRCRQIMEHPWTLGPPLDQIKLTGKEESLDVHLEHHLETRQPLVIFGSLQASVEHIAQICQKKGLRVGMIHGGVPTKKRFLVDEQFRQGELDVVVATAATAGVGFNWPHVNHIIFMSLDYMDSNFVQAYRRAVRGKREKPVLIRIMEYKDTVDQKIFAIIERKSALSNAVDESKERIYIQSKPQPKSKAAPMIMGKPTMSMLTS
jgi:hypothetical protein